ncbi:TPA: hypothetical protein HA265_07795 [Candidatus Woesearchaeota archaeon]|nr:hypothetical protein [Candidatus Woesearchaeota archaeon]
MTEKRGKKRAEVERKTSSESANKAGKRKTSRVHKKAKARPSELKKVEREVEKEAKKVEKEVLVEGKKVEHELEEEFFVPSPRHIGKYKIPLGIKFMIGYLIFISALYLLSFLSGLSFPTTILFGKLVTGSKALIINSMLLVLVLFMIYGFWKRKWYTFDLAISFFGFSAMNSLLSLTLLEGAEIPAFKKLLMLSFVSIIFMNVLVIWYILHERKYFFAKSYHDRPIQQRDKIFLYALATFWVVAILVGSTVGMQFYGESKVMVDKAVKGLQGNIAKGESVCDKEEGPQKDVCYLVLVTARTYNNEGSTEGLCDRIQSDFYRLACMRTTGFSA